MKLEFCVIDMYSHVIWIIWKFKLPKLNVVSTLNGCDIS